MEQTVQPAAPGTPVAPVAPAAQPIAPAQEPGAQVVTPAPSEPAANWYDSDSYKEHVPGNEGHFQKYKTEGEFVKASIEAMKGRSSEAIPKPDDPKYAEKMTALYDSMGRPDKADAYEIKLLEVPEALQSRISFSDELQTAAKELAASRRWSQEDLDAVAELQQKFTIETEQAWFDKRLEQSNAAEEVLKKDANYATNKALTDRLLAKPEYEGLVQELAESNLGNYPAMFNIVAAYAKEQIGEGTIDPASPGSAPAAAQPNSEAATKRAEYEEDKARWPHSAPTTWRHSAEFHKA